MNQLLEERAQFQANAFGCSFTVHGIQESGGSKRIGRNRATGKRIIIDDNPEAAGWKQQVGIVAGTLMRSRKPFEGPLRLDVTFFRPRPKSHYGVRGLLPSAPKYPIVRPDATKLLRPLEDALTGILWNDDNQIVTQMVQKRYCNQHEEPRAIIEVRVIV